MARRYAFKLAPVYHVLYFLARAYHFAWYRKFQVAGRENIPRDNPVIFAANHQNALMDALAVLFAVGRPVAFLARADIFRKRSVARLLRFIRILPVYRIRDGYSSLGQNRETFDEVSAVLSRNHPIGIFPEGFHLGRKKLKPLRKGVARMALQAEENAGFTLDLQIVPVGLDYSDYFTPGSSLLVIFGKPLPVSVYREKYLENPALAIRCLVDDLEGAMRGIMIDVYDDDQHDHILEKARQYATGELQRQKLRDNPLNRFLLEKKFTTGTESLSGVFPPKNPGFKKSRALWLLPVSPVIAAGVIMKLPPYLMASRIAGKIPDPHLEVSARFGVSFILCLAWYLVLATIIIVVLLSRPLMIIGLLLLLAAGVLLRSDVLMKKFIKFRPD